MLLFLHTIRGLQTSRTLVQIISLESATGVSIIPVAVHHAADLASLVRQNIEHLRPCLLAVADLEQGPVCEVPTPTIHLRHRL